MSESRTLKPASGASMRTLVLATLLGLSMPVLAGSVSYTYDQLGRVKTATYSNGVVITYTYDAAGNRVSQVTTGVP
ncbi:RHS repeat domain-containing protein [Thauera butanivorans]|uniref:RHS repeat domain-containing protein n=1 Tax=Thauera butanivorans TaxID=86174 RepID=UPI001C3F3D0C|nr:RHS repeat domain-containing protein [Thauera butanivorans]